MNDYKSIQFEVVDAVATLTLNRSECDNVLTAEMDNEIQQAMKEVEGNTCIRAVILTGAGRSFCIGREVSEGISPRSGDAADFAQEGFDTLASVRASRVPVVVAVNGIAAGTGFSLALCGDLLLAALSASFVQLPEQFTIEPNLESGSLFHAVGRPGSLGMLKTDEPVAAEKALRWGLINECLEDGELQTRAREWAEALAQGPTRALVMTRQLVDEGTVNSFEEQFRRELQTNRELRASYDGKEGVQAFLEKRPAQFSGK